MKRELFRRAAHTRGDDDPTFEPVVAGSTLRLDRTALKSADALVGSATCTGTATLDLPEGFRAAGGRTSLAADITYILQQAADQSGTVATITDADGLTIPLASIAQSGSVAASGGARRTEVAVGAPTKQYRPSATSRVPIEARRRAAEPQPPAPPLVEAPRSQASRLPARQAESSPREPSVRLGASGGWQMARSVEQGSLKTKIYVQRAGDGRPGANETTVRIRYVGTLKGNAPVETITEEAVDCASGFHTQHSYLVRNAQGRVVATRGLQPRRRVLPGSLLGGTLSSICGSRR